MDHSSKHQGELSLLEMIQNLQSPNGRKTPDSSLSSASLNIALNEEKHRRQVVESSFIKNSKCNLVIFTLCKRNAKKSSNNFSLKYRPCNKTMPSRKQPSKEKIHC